MSQAQSNGLQPELLFIAPDFPSPPDRGQRVRILNLIEACARDFAGTLIAPPPEPGADKKALDALCRRVIQADSGRIAAGPQKLSLGERLSSRQRRAMAPYRAALEGVDLDRFAAIWIERGHLACLADGRRERTIVDLDDIEHVRHARLLRSAPSALAKLKMLPRAGRLLHRETVGMSGYAGVVVCAESDRAYLARLGVRNVWVVPNGTDLAEAAPRAAEPDRDCVFMGNFDYPPNADAAAHLRDDIVPRLRNARPSFRVDLIGRGSHELTDPAGGVRGLGYVDDLAGELARYRVFAAPLRLGGGTKLKVIDAMAAGTPVVTTPIGAEGLDLVHGRHALIADDEAAFADCVALALGDRDLRMDLARNALAHVRDRFAWTTIRATLADRLAGRFGASAAPLAGRPPDAAR